MTIKAVQGRWDAKFDQVAEAFERNLDQGGDVGASFAVMVGGKPVIDIWGGYRDPERTTPWTEDTLINVWSSTKGVNATAFAMLVDRGLVRYSDPVAQFWPAFGAAGKQAVTVGQFLSHQAGVCGFDTPATVEDLYGGSAAAARLAAQAPFWPPATASGYHAISIGILSAELFHRIEGRRLKDFIAEEIARPFGLDLQLGLAAADNGRAATMIAPAAMASDGIGALTPAQTAALANPPLSPLLPNTKAWRQAELSSANGFTNARALAGLYARLLPGGVDGRQLVSPSAMSQATSLQIEGTDLVLDLHARWGAGFLLNSEDLYGPSHNTFGHSGWGGSFAFGDPDRRIAVSYTMNAMSQALRGDPRGVSLIDATYQAI